MLIHAIPTFFHKCWNPLDIRLETVKLDPWGIILNGTEELKTGRPYTNKYYRIGSRKDVRKAEDGFFVETSTFEKTFTITSSWVFSGKFKSVHEVEVTVLDRDFDAVTMEPRFWYAFKSAQDKLDWTSRWPEGYASVPVYWKPAMVLATSDNLPERQGVLTLQDTTTDMNLSLMAESQNMEVVVQRQQKFHCPTVERERLARYWGEQRMPDPAQAFVDANLKHS